MKIFRTIVSIIGVCLFSAVYQKVEAQLYYQNTDLNDNPMLYEAGISIGIMNCFTDVGGRKGLGQKFIKDLNIGNTQLNGSIYVSALYKYAVGLRLEGTFGNINAHDSILKAVKATSQGRYERSLQFRSKITEVALLAELHPRQIINLWFGRDVPPPILSPYILAGAGYYAFNPQAKLNSNWIDLQPLSTEGQGFIEYPNRKIYKLKQINIPVGLGFRFDISNAFNLRLEYLHRFLKTDYLDDLSTRYINPALFSKYFTGTQLSNALALNDRRSKFNSDYPVNPTGGQIRGNPTDNDSYFTMNIKAGFTFGGGSSRGNRNGLDRNGQLRCPTRF